MVTTKRVNEFAGTYGVWAIVQENPAVFRATMTRGSITSTLLITLSESESTIESPDGLPVDVAMEALALVAWLRDRVGNDSESRAA